MRATGLAGEPLVACRVSFRRDRVASKTIADREEVVMGENRKPAVTARQSARARAAEKMAERKQREKLIADGLESFFAADLLVVDAEKAREDAIAKANEAFEAATARAHDEKAGHARVLKDLGLTDREIADLIDQPVSAVRDLLKSTKAAPAPASDEKPAPVTPASQVPASASAEPGADTDVQIAS